MTRHARSPPPPPRCIEINRITRHYFVKQVPLQKVPKTPRSRCRNTSIEVSKLTHNHRGFSLRNSLLECLTSRHLDRGVATPQSRCAPRSGGTPGSTVHTDQWDDTPFWNCCNILAELWCLGATFGLSFCCFITFCARFSIFQYLNGLINKDLSMFLNAPMLNPIHKLDLLTNVIHTWAFPWRPSPSVSVAWSSTTVDHVWHAGHFKVLFTVLPRIYCISCIWSLVLDQ